MMGKMARKYKLIKGLIISSTVFMSFCFGIAYGQTTIEPEIITQPQIVTQIKYVGSSYSHTGGLSCMNRMAGGMSGSSGNPHICRLSTPTPVAMQLSPSPGIYAKEEVSLS